MGAPDPVDTGGGAPQPTYIVQDDFSTDGDTGLRRGCTFDYSCTRALVDGQEVGVFEVHADDYDWSNRSTKSAELATPLLTDFDTYQQTREFWAGFRFMVSEGDLAPEDYVILEQQHGEPDRSLGEWWRNPVSALRLQNGVLWYHYLADSRQVSLPVDQADGGYDPRCTMSLSTYTDCGDVELLRLKRDHWYDMVIHEFYDFNGAGFVEVSLTERSSDGTITATSSLERHGISIGFNDLVGPFWKFGLYEAERPPAQPTARVCFDDVKIGVGPGQMADYMPP